MKNDPVPTDVAAALSDYQHYYIIPHIEPDGDCVSSALALASFLERRGKQVHLHNLGPFTRKDIAQWADRFSGRIDPAGIAPGAACAVVVDCSTIDRIGDLAQDVAGLPTVVVDHHSSGHPFGDHRFVNPSSPSTSLLVQQIIESAGGGVTQAEAELIMFGFCTDTGYFRHLDAGSGLAFELVSRLVDAGASPKRIHAQLNSGAALVGRQHLGMLLQRTQSLADGKLLFTWETKAETDAVGKANRDSDLLYQMLLSVAGVEVVAVLREEGPRAITGGLRSKSCVDVGKVALALGGGGHVRAAGFLVEAELDQVRDRLLPLLLEEIASNCK